MVDVHHHRCVCESGRPSFGRVGDRKPTCCVLCKTEDMVDLVSIKCPCGTVATFGDPTRRRPECCTKCKKAGMVDLAHKKCRCGRARPSFNVALGMEPVCCKVCKTGDMIDVCSALCACGKHMIFAFPGEKPSRCFGCKSDGMVDVRNVHCPCERQCTFGLPGTTVAVACKRCKTPDMVDLRHVKCKHCRDTRANPRYRGHCLFCFMHKFPDEPVARNYKTKERAVQEFLTASFGSTRTLVFDRVVEPVVPAGADEFEVVPCSRRRPDVLIDMGTYVVVVEIDENQHDTYETMCENRRAMEIFRDSGRRPLVMIRFNPDGYTDESGRKHPSPWGVQKHTGVLSVMPKRRAAWDARLEALRVAVASALAAPPVKDVTFVFLYF